MEIILDFFTENQERILLFFNNLFVTYGLMCFTKKFISYLLPSKKVIEVVSEILNEIEKVKDPIINDESETESDILSEIENLSESEEENKDENEYENEVKLKKRKRN